MGRAAGVGAFPAASVFSGRVWEHGDGQSHVLFTGLSCSFPLCLSRVVVVFFLSEPFLKSPIRDAWEGADLLFQNYSIGSRPR